MGDRHPLDTAGEVGFPVGFLAGNTVDHRPLFVGQITIPAEFGQRSHGKFRIPVFDIRIDRPGALGQQIVAIPFNPEPGAEGQAALTHRFRRIVEDRCPRMAHFRRTPARPGHAVIFAIQRAANGLQRGFVKGMLVGHMGAQPLWRLTGITNGPHAFVDFPRDVFNQRLIIFHLDVFEQLISKAKLCRKLIGDGVIRQRFKQRIDNRITPLDRPVRRGHRAIGFELGRGRQQVNAISPI